MKLIEKIIANSTLLIFFMLMCMAFRSPEKILSGEYKSLGAAQRDSLFSLHVCEIYKACGLDTQALSYTVFEKALTGFYNLKTNNPSSQKNIISIVDFQKTSVEKRLWVIDIKNTKVLFHTLVAHGKNSGENEAMKFSDTPNSFMSSLGFYYTGDTYIGKHGFSLRLEGLDKGFNTNAKDRAIVMHGAEYVCEEFIQCNGRLGRSQGCPALPPDMHKEIISAIEGGTVLFVHHPFSGYQSLYLDRSTAANQFLIEKNKLN